MPFSRESGSDSSWQSSDTGDDVAALQSFLAEETFLPPPPPGSSPASAFDGATREALARWQAAVGVPPTGTFGDASRLAYMQMQARLCVSLLLCLACGPQMLSLVIPLHCCYSARLGA